MIEGIDAITYSTDCWEDARKFFSDWGLRLVRETPTRVDWVTLNDCGVSVVRLDDQVLPPPIEAGPTLREVVWGVTQASDLNALATALALAPGFKDNRASDGTVRALDPHGLQIVFRVSQKKKIDAVGSPSNPWGDVRRVDAASPVYDRAEPVSKQHYMADFNRLGPVING